MKAVVFKTIKCIKIDDVPDPKIQLPTNALVRVTSTAICGSDLHIYNGYFPQLKPFVLGHEFMGIVEEVGAEVQNVRRGDRVVVPFPISCGQCWFCASSFPTHCERSNPRHYGPEGGLLSQKGGALYGYTELYGGYPGGQAQWVRVPYADHGPRKVPDDLKDEQVLFLTDILPTGYSGLRWANLKPGETVAVFGCGPVGLMTMKLAQVMGASKVIGVDILSYRVEMARRAAGALVVDASKTDPIQAIREWTEGRGVDVCIDAVGMESDRTHFFKKVANIFHLQRGNITAIERCFSAVRRGGRVSILGVYGTDYDNFPVGQWFDKGLRVQAGQAPVQNYIDELIEMVVSKKIRLDDIITHKLPLAEAPHAYDIFNRKKDGCVKVVLDPWG